MLERENLALNSLIYTEPVLNWESKSFRAHVGLAINICRAATGAVPYTLVLPNSCQQCKASSGQREQVAVRVAIENR